MQIDIEVMLIIFFSETSKDLSPSKTTKSKAPKPPGIKLTNPDNAAITKMPINVINDT